MDFLKDFGVQPTLLIAQVVNFTIILLILRKFLFGPITKVLDQRKQKIAESLKNAQEIEEKLAQTEAKTAQILEGARSTAQSIIDEAKKEAQRLAAQAAEETRQTVEATMASVQKQMEVEKIEMKKQIESETMLLTSSLVKKILGRSMKQEEKNQLTAKSMSEITKGING